MIAPRMIFDSFREPRIQPNRLVLRQICLLNRLECPWYPCLQSAAEYSWSDSHQFTDWLCFCGSRSKMASFEHHCLPWRTFASWPDSKREPLEFLAPCYCQCRALQDLRILGGIFHAPPSTSSYANEAVWAIWDVYKHWAPSKACFRLDSSNLACPICMFIASQGLPPCANLSPKIHQVCFGSIPKTRAVSDSRGCGVRWAFHFHKLVKFKVTEAGQYRGANWKALHSNSNLTPVNPKFGALSDSHQLKPCLEDLERYPA